MPAGTNRPWLRAARLCGSVLATVALWTLWLALALFLFFQAYIASVHELEVPRFLLNEIEAHLAQSGASVTFGRAVFDPYGRILIEKARFKLNSFNEPVVTAAAIYIRLDPWALLERQFEPKEIRVTGADLFIPAMLSPSGRPEKVVEGLDAGFSITSRGNEFNVDYFNCLFGAMSLSARGSINSGTVARNNSGEPSLPLAAFVSKNYVALSEEFSHAEDRFAVLDGAVVAAVLTPSDTRGAIVRATLWAKGLKTSGPLAVEAQRIRATVRFPLLGGAPLMASASASAESLKVGEKVSALAVHARIRGILRVDTLDFSPRQLDLTAGSVTGWGVELVAPVATLVPGTGRQFAADASGWLYGRPVWTHSVVDPAAQSADITFDASVSPGLLGPLSDWTGFPIRRFADLSEPVTASGSVHLGAGWKLATARGRVDGRNLTAYGVKMDECRGNITYDGRHLAAREAIARSGDNIARGSYEQDLSTLKFRYLLTGRLRPLDISAWFSGGWWQNIFKGFGFPDRPPDADLEVHGHYKHGRDFSVFGYADAVNPTIRGVALDRLRTRLLIDQSELDGFEVDATKGAGTAQGSFKVTFEPLSGTWSGMDLDVTSTLDPASVATLLPSGGGAAAAVFSFDKPPSIVARGHFDGPAAPGARHTTLHTEVRSTSNLRVHGVAFSRAFFKFDLNDDDLNIGQIEAGFAGGTAIGTADLKGTGADSRLRFKASLTDGSLGQAAEASEGYVVSQRPGSSIALDTFARDKSGVRLDLNASAEGHPGDLDTFTGDGNFQIQGAQLGEISLLGGLSHLLKITELRFTQAQAEFKIANALIVFPMLKIIGANSAIDAKGTYSIEKRQLDFSAKISPFQESKSVLVILNAISAPLSAVFTVRLTGTIDKPSWSIRPLYSPLTPPPASEMKASAPDKNPAPFEPSPLANPLP
jgi:hypothetical protein